MDSSRSGQVNGSSLLIKLSISVPDSVKFCHRVGLTYVSCSPYRVPVARLAAAQAAIEEKRAAGAKKK